MKLILGCLGLVFVVLGIAFLEGIVLVQLWNWFVVTSFGVPSISFSTALGIGLIVGMYTQKIESKKESKTKEENIDTIIIAFLRPLLSLFVGYILHLL